MTIPSKFEQHIFDILLEIQKAESKHPVWPRDAIKAAAIVAEESGELCAASLQWNDEDGEFEAMRKEAIQVACTAIRFLTGLDKYKQRIDFELLQAECLITTYRQFIEAQELEDEFDEFNERDYS